MKRVYLDHNATTPIRPEVRERLLATLDAVEGNPSSVHAAGRWARQILDEAREEVASALGVTEDEVIFTSGGTEANNLALFGILRASGRAAGAGGLVTTAVEHAAVLDPAAVLEQQGFSVTRVGVDPECRVDVDAIVNAAEGAALVSVMAAGNEVGVINPIETLARSLEERYGANRPRLHVDAVQALGRVPVALRARGIDAASFSAHKIGGPTGCGVLFRAAGTRIDGLMFGGGQEIELRPGTENVPAAAASALAVRLAVEEQREYAQRVSELANLLWDELRTALPDACLLGPALDASDRLPNTLNVAIPGIDGRVLVTRLDLAGLEVSAGSACASGSLEPSHVLRAMGMSEEAARSGLRLSLGRTTTRDDVHIAVDIMSRTLGERT
ncbi:MAG: cysteine desulfurase [bacterium]|nr:cysteine desulfurase [bacterium]